jgi:hypothetical protein
VAKVTIITKGRIYSGLNGVSHAHEEFAKADKGTENIKIKVIKIIFIFFVLFIL